LQHYDPARAQKTADRREELAMKLPSSVVGPVISIALDTAFAGITGAALLVECRPAEGRA